MAKFRCKICHDKGFVKTVYREIVPCWNCNSDGMFDPKDCSTRRCNDPRGGGGRTCYLAADHKGSHAFQCGKD